LNRLTFARLFQALYLIVIAAFVFLPDGPRAKIHGDTTLLVAVSLMTAILFVSLRCRRCAASLYYSPSVPLLHINLLIPAKRQCPKCGAARD
jgi:hypothetical protein